MTQLPTRPLWTDPPDDRLRLLLLTRLAEPRIVEAAAIVNDADVDAALARIRAADAPDPLFAVQVVILDTVEDMAAVVTNELDFQRRDDRLMFRCGRCGS